MCILVKLSSENYTNDCFFLQIIFLGIWARWLCRSPSLQSHPNVLPRLHKVNFLRKIFHICNYFIISLMHNFYIFFTYLGILKIHLRVSNGIG